MLNRKERPFFIACNQTNHSGTRQSFSELYNYYFLQAIKQSVTFVVDSSLKSGYSVQTFPWDSSSPCSQKLAIRP